MGIEKLNERMTRRDVLKAGGMAAGAFLATPLLAACSSSATQAPTDAPASGAPSGAPSSPSASLKTPNILVVQDAGGSYGLANKTAIYDAFSKEYNIPVAQVTMTIAQFMAQADAGEVESSYIETSLMPIMNMWNKGYLAELDYSVIGQGFNINDIPEVQREKPYTIGKAYWATAMAYRTDVFTVDNHPKGWAEFWDVQKFPGLRAMQNEQTDRPELEFALLADGVPADQLYPLDVNRALESMTKLRPSIPKFWGSGAESASLIDTKEVDVMSIWTGRAQALKDAGRPVELEWAQARRQVNCLCIPKKAPYPEWGQRMVDFALRPEAQASVADAMGYGPVNKAADALVKPETQEKLASNPKWFDSGFDMNVEWWLENLESATQAWSAWFQKG